MNTSRDEVGRVVTCSGLDNDESADSEDIEGEQEEGPLTGVCPRLTLCHLPGSMVLASALYVVREGLAH